MNPTQTDTRSASASKAQKGMVAILLSMAEVRASRLAQNLGVPKEKTRDVLFLPSYAVAGADNAPYLYEAHLDEMEARINGLLPPLFSEGNREHLLEPTRAEVLATCLVEFDPDEAQERGADTFDTLTVWLIYDVLDGYVEAELFDREPEELFEDWQGDDSIEKLREVEDRLVANQPREFFVDGRFFDLPSERPLSEVTPGEMVRH